MTAEIKFEEMLKDEALIYQLVGQIPTPFSHVNNGPHNTPQAVLDTSYRYAWEEGYIDLHNGMDLHNGKPSGDHCYDDFLDIVWILLVVYFIEKRRDEKYSFPLKTTPSYYTIAIRSSQLYYVEKFFMNHSIDFSIDSDSGPVFVTILINLEDDYGHPNFTVERSL